MSFDGAKRVVYGVVCGGPLVMGHRVGGRLIDFPHRCPGDGCAVFAWIADRQLRRDLERTEAIVDKWQPQQEAMA